MFQTGVGMNILIMTVMSFIVGLSISGQTFYTFVLENLEKFGALKAMGAKSRELILMILFQASFTALTGYGLGIGLCALTDHARQAEAPGLRRDDHLLESRAGLRHGGDHRRRFELFRRPQSIADRAVRYFPGLICRIQPSQQRASSSGSAKARPGRPRLRDVSLDAYFGEMLYIVGPSGSGKTTLLSVLSGILRPDSGSVSVEGADIWNSASDKLADFRLHKIGFVFQDYHLFPRLTTAENVAIPLILKRTDWGEAMVEASKYLEIVGLKSRAELPPVKLSGGEQQRVAIARAIAGQPDILIMDEPTASLDGDTGPGHRSVCEAEHSQ